MSIQHKEELIKRFKILISNNFNFGWYIRPDHQDAYHLTGFKIEEPRLDIYRGEGGVIISIYEDKIVYHHTSYEQTFHYEGLIGIIDVVQARADENFETNIKPHLYNLNNVNTPPGFSAQFAKKEKE